MQLFFIIIHLSKYNFILNIFSIDSVCKIYLYFRCFRQWLISSFLYGSHKEANIPREDLNTSVAAHFNLTLQSIIDSEYENSLSILVLNNVDPSWFFNVSYMIQFLSNELNKSDFFIQLKSHQDTPWQFVNYHLESKCDAKDISMYRYAKVIKVSVNDILIKIHCPMIIKIFFKI